nr:unnamed protein product [Callosobruchus analis]
MVDNNNKTGRGCRSFTSEKEIEEIFRKKRNVHPYGRHTPKERDLHRRKCTRSHGKRGPGDSVIHVNVKVSLSNSWKHLFFHRAYRSEHDRNVMKTIFIISICRQFMFEKKLIHILTETEQLSISMLLFYHGLFLIKPFVNDILAFQFFDYVRVCIVVKSSKDVESVIGHAIGKNLTKLEKGLIFLRENVK